MQLFQFRKPLRALLVAVATMVSASTVRADSLDDVYQFLRENAVNRTLSRSSSGVLPGGDIAYEFQRDMTICNLTRTKNHFTYDAVYLIKQRNWDLENGERSGSPRVEDRIIVVRHELGGRKSTGEVIGHLKILSSTSENFGGVHLSLRMKLAGEKLEVETATPRYDDYFAAGGTFYPGAMVSKETWSIQDGKLIVETQSTTYRVDPESGEREAIEDKEPKERDIESAKLPLN